MSASSPSHSSSPHSSPSDYPKRDLVGHENLLVYFNLYREHRQYEKEAAAEALNASGPPIAPPTFESVISDLPGPSLFYHSPDVGSSAKPIERHLNARDTFLSQFLSFGDLPPRYEIQSLTPAQLRSLSQFRPGPALDLAASLNKLHTEREEYFKQINAAKIAEDKKRKRDDS